MRRRQIEQARQAAAENAAVSVSSEWDFGPGLCVTLGKSLPKGTCSHCGKHIGRGLHFHERACKG